MSQVEAKSSPRTTGANSEIVGSPGSAARAAPRWGASILALMLTFVAVGVAVVLGRATWQAYVEAPWTRDGTMRAYVVTMAPEVSGRVVGLPVIDNQFVHNGDPLMVIDPTNYAIAVRLAEAAVKQAKSTMENVQREAERRRELPLSAVTVEEQK